MSKSASLNLVALRAGIQALGFVTSFGSTNQGPPPVCMLWRAAEVRPAEVAPDFGTSGIVGSSLLRMGQDGAADDEDETED